MNFTYDSKIMAQALSIVGEAGIHGMEYNAIFDLMSEKTYRRQSGRFRVSLFSARKFTPREFEDYLILAWRFGFVRRSTFKEADWFAGSDKSSYQIEDEIVILTREGWEFVETNIRPLLHRWGTQISENVPAILVGVLIAVAGQSVLDWLGYG